MGEYKEYKFLPLKLSFIVYHLNKKSTREAVSSLSQALQEHNKNVLEV